MQDHPVLGPGEDEGKVALHDQAGHAGPHADLVKDEASCSEACMCLTMESVLQLSPQLLSQEREREREREKERERRGEGGPPFEGAMTIGN